MPISIELTFDRRTTKTIRAVWDELTSERIQYEPHQKQALPHITLAVRDATTNATRPFQFLAERLIQFPVSFGSAGMFLRPRGLNYTDDSDGVVLFLSPKPTAALLEAHQIANGELRGWNRGRWAHYKPQQWVPHCTLAEHLAKRDVSKALNICGDKLDWPIAGWVCGIRSVNFGPGMLQELASQPLAPARRGSSTR